MAKGSRSRRRCPSTTGDVSRRFRIAKATISNSTNRQTAEPRAQDGVEGQVRIPQPHRVV
jgi:hypothetical protein